MDTKQRVGLRIKAIRNSKGLTQAELADLIKRSTEAVSNIERGISHPSFQTLEQLSETLEVPVREFFDFDDEKKVSPKRAKLLEELRSTVTKLNDKQLAIAVEQVKALLG